MSLLELCMLISILILTWWCSLLGGALNKITKILEEHSIFIPDGHKANFLRMDNTSIVNIDGINEEVYSIVITKKFNSNNKSPK